MEKSGIIFLGILSILVIVVAVSGCTGGSKQYSDARVSFSYPENWNISDQYNTKTYVTFKAQPSELIEGEVSSYTLQPGETIEGYIAKSNRNFSAPKTLNGYTFYNSSETDPTDERIVYNEGMFVKDGVVYNIVINGNTAIGDVNGAYNNITQSFRIK